MNSETNNARRIKPRIRPLNGYWVCHAQASCYMGIGVTPLEAYEDWRNRLACHWEVVLYGS